MRGNDWNSSRVVEYGQVCVLMKLQFDSIFFIDNADHVMFDKKKKKKNGKHESWTICENHVNGKYIAQ